MCVRIYRYAGMAARNYESFLHLHLVLPRASRMPFGKRAGEYADNYR